MHSSRESPVGTGTDDEEYAAPSSIADGDVCWICHQDHGSLSRACSCNMYAHPVCLARWQLRCAGKCEEQVCRICQDKLPDWRKLVQVEKSAVPVRVVCANQAHTLVSHPGESYESFQSRVWSVCGLASGTPLELSFNFDDPFTGDTISVKGCGAFKAAIHCGATKPLVH